MPLNLSNNTGHPELQRKLISRTTREGGGDDAFRSDRDKGQRCSGQLMCAADTTWKGGDLPHVQAAPCSLGRVSRRRPDGRLVRSCSAVAASGGMRASIARALRTRAKMATRPRLGHACQVE